MHRILSLIACLLAVLAAIPARAEPADIAATARSVVRVVLVAEEAGEPSLVGHGSGFAIGPDLILTNAHVVAPAREGEGIRIGIVPSQGTGGWFGRVVAVAPEADLALVRLTEKGTLPPTTLFTGPLGDGADVFAVGYPGNVDLAQGLNVGDIVSPTSPVKTRGNISAGRSSKGFETLLHTAPIGSGNSGGPLLDACGRVIGANSFGTVSGDGDSEFYFAISAREIIRFLRNAGVTPRTTGIACRSLAEIDRIEAERLAGERVHSEDEARAAATKQRDALEKAERTALFAIIGEREAGMALAGLALLLALAAGAAAFVFHDRERSRAARLAGAAAGVLVIAAGAAWLLRPGLAEVDERAKDIVAIAAAPPKPIASGKANSGDLVCSIEPARSRVTVSDIADVALAWRGDGCADGKEQYGLDARGWSRVSAPDDEDSVKVTSFDPASGAYRVDRYFLDLDTLARLRAERRGLPPASCGGNEQAARRLGEAQAALKALLPPAPNERLIYSCRDAS